MLPDRVSNPGPLTYESGALPIALRGPANNNVQQNQKRHAIFFFIKAKFNMEKIDKHKHAHGEI